MRKTANIIGKDVIRQKLWHRNFVENETTMKRLNLNFIAILIMLCLWMLSCKENKDLSTDAAPSETTRDDGFSIGDDAIDDASGEGSNVIGDAVIGNATTASGSAVPPETSANGNPAKRAVSGDGSDGRTSGTSVNKAKNVQVDNRTNARRAGEGGYSAPDGTPAENYDGDMYTKHDTTRMPSGSTPIK